MGYINHYTELVSKATEAFGFPCSFTEEIIETPYTCTM